MITLTTLHDSEGRFVPLVKEAEDFLVKYFQLMVIGYTEATSIKTISYLDSLGFDSFSSGTFGEARIKALKRAMRKDDEHFFVCDFDKILHWIRIEPDELVRVLLRRYFKDITSIGRSEEIFRTYPDSWYMPETSINGIVSKIVGKKMDVLTAVFVMRRKAAEVIVESAKEKGWGSCVEWLLLCNKAGLSIGNWNAKGLSWEDPERFKSEMKRAGGLKKWKEENYNSIDEWEKRLTSALEQIEVIKRLS